MDIKKKTKVALEYLRTGNLQQAERTFREILTARPRNSKAYHYLGDILMDTGSHEEAVACYQKAIELNPGFAGTYYNVASLLREEGRLEEALEYYQKVISLEPGFANAYNAAGAVFQSKGQLDEAITYYQKALALDPQFAFAYNNLGTVFLQKGYLDDAIACYQKSVTLDPRYAKAYNGLGMALQDKGWLEEAMAEYQKALHLNPNLAEALNNLGRVFQARGQCGEAEMHYRRAIRIKPDDVVPYQNLLFLMLYDSRHDQQAIVSEHRTFAELFEAPLQGGLAHYVNEKTFNRRLKVGYVSPDFRRHSVACFIEPVLTGHNREHFEIFCYSLVSGGDDVTDRLRGHADQWRSIAGMSDEKAAELIREDGIDILVDLAGHTANNRILVFARKPAPVQANWIGYPATTGLSAMDYKIADGHTDPSGMTEQFYTEKLIRMPESFLCYLPDREGPEADDLPVFSAGHITFGSFNNFAKVSPEVIELWTTVLKTIPSSRLVMKARSFSDRSTREYAMEKFVHRGISSGRLEFLPPEPSTREHLRLYNRIDIGLDTFPYNGTTTTCEALWMGVPVITLAGDTHASRVGVSLLTNAGLPELIAETIEEYVSIAVDLAGNLKRLQILRESLRGTMAYSALTDAKRFTSALESRYREMWKLWCNNSGH
jgi:protein O-GlcNAc transferase